jgi:hypothetical protein
MLVPVATRFEPGQEMRLFTVILTAQLELWLDSFNELRQDSFCWNKDLSME